MIFQYGSETVLIQQILIGFEAILQMLFQITITANYTLLTLMKIDFLHCLKFKL